MTGALDFQSIIMTLEEYWAGRGCLIWQPYHTEVGAGTMNPATSLRVLGPEPWNVGYVEPSIRPDDGRYGENPNRFYQHIQYQVILKPDPGNPQELYLKSLEALGIDPRVHDIRFVEDNWKSPALGAWGLGWEVWLNGLEITQYTYFQQAGGQPLDPVSVELTYGLERIAMALQRVRDFKNIRWNQQLSYGDVQLQSEQQFSQYAFELADVDTLREMFQLYEQEAERCLTEKQVLPAHDFVLKCSHTFNLLDTRGAVGVTERQAFFHRMRELSRRVAGAYLEEREALGFPWLEKEPGDVPYLGESYPAAEYPQDTAPFLLEIGTEELPHGDARDAVQQLNSLIPEMLKDLRLNCQETMILATPRRLVVYLQDLEPYQEDLEQLVKGPPEDRAYDMDGSPTKAAEGFARSKGVAVEDLETREMDGGRYVAAVEKQEGRPTGEVLIEALPALIGSLKFELSMRWNASNAAFSRPIRWLLALHGEYWLPFSFAGIQSGSCTRGLRFLEGGDIEVCSPDDYLQTLRQQGIILDQNQRGERIAEDLEKLAEQTGGTVPPDPALLSEVTYLVEAPTALLGEFDPEYLELPREVLISVMKKHQRYFPVEKDGRLLPYFITVANKPSGAGEFPELSVITQGNADVILARFADAAYFVHADRDRSLEEFLPDLALLTFQVDLGSMLDKTRRVHTLVKKLAPMISLTGKDLQAAQRAAELCKADLATQMVVEMTSLQGVMGYYYALESGESEAAARAIREHYLPASADDPAPETKAGLAVGIADRLDSLLGLFAAGLAPTGSKDPFALRRAALGLVGNLISWDLDFDLKTALEKTAEDLPVDVSPQTRRETLEFIIDRLRHYLLDNGAAYDVVDAILSEQGYNPAGAYRAVQDLEKWVQREDWELILDSYARCVRITRSLEKSYPVVEDFFEEGEEKALYQALKKAEAFERQPGDLQAFLTTFTPLIPYIADFFDNVLVMAEEEALQENRLGLLQRVAALAEGTVEMSRLEGF